MNNDDRDKLIQETHDAVIRMLPMVNDHHMTLYGDGSKGNKGLKMCVGILKERVEQHPLNCEARKAVSVDRKNHRLSLFMAILAVTSLIATVIVNIVTLLRT